MILKIFILILAVEIIAKRPPQTPPDGGPIIKHKKGVRDPEGCIRPPDSIGGKRMRW